ncbi:hypothetical protein [Nocardiopsis nanhaiensis]
MAPRVIAAAGYRHWPGDTAHLCVLTASDQRGQGLALGLGFRELASQLSLHLA